MYKNKKNLFRNLYCTKCGKNGHEYKKCDNAVVSMGIILLKFDYADIKELFSDIEKKSETDIDIRNNGIRVDNYLDILIFSKLREKIKFLMIRRKHTLGYIEFIRGRYKLDNTDGIIFLFQQMTKEEINKIGRMNFMDLWNDFWIDPSKKLLNDKEFQRSKEKFEKLKDEDENELTIDYYVKYVDPVWDQAEWGFPKGRRKKLESNLECAMREFEEESNFTSDDYIVLEGIKPVTEEFIGTNGIKYKHIYYIAYSNSSKVPSIDPTNIHQATEIGDIGFYTYNDVMNMIRPYHMERKKIVTQLFSYVIEKIIIEQKMKNL